MKKTISLLLSMIIILGLMLPCGAEDETGDSFEINAKALEWIRVDDPSAVFLLQTDELYTMSRDARFTAYSSFMNPIEEVSGGSAMWRESSFTDPDGTERKVWILPIDYAAIRYLRFSPGAFADKAGKLSPEICSKLSHTAMSSFYGYSKSLARLQTVKTDADFTEGDVLAYPQLSTGMDASYFSLLIKTDEGVSSAKFTYDENHDLVCPARVGTAEYTLMFCGQPIGETQTLKTITEEEYNALYEKDRVLSVLKGTALIPCLPGYIVYCLIQTTLIHIAFSPSAAAIPLAMLTGPVMGLREGFVSWWKTVSSLIGGKG